MTVRTDAHSPLNLVTEDYEYLWCFDSQAPGFLVNVDMDWWRSITNFDPQFEDRGTGQCHHCGARLRYVALLRHVPTGYAIAVGETCLDNRFERATADFHRVRKQAQLDQKAHRIVKAAAEVLSDLDPDVYSALVKAEPESFPNDASKEARNHHIVSDIRRKLHTYGDLSVPQLNLVGRIIMQQQERLNRQAAQAEEVHIPAPVGRVTFSGIVVGRKWKDSDYGGSFKITVKVTDPAGIWLAWVSEPSAVETTHGDEIVITATLTRSDSDESFAFGKRPSKCKIIGHRDGVAEVDALA